MNNLKKISHIDVNEEYTFRSDSQIINSSSDSLTTQSILIIRK